MTRSKNSKKAMATQASNTEIEEPTHPQTPNAPDEEAAPMDEAEDQPVSDPLQRVVQQIDLLTVLLNSKSAEQQAFQRDVLTDLKPHKEAVQQQIATLRTSPMASTSGQAVGSVSLNSQIMGTQANGIGANPSLVLINQGELKKFQFSSHESFNQWYTRFQLRFASTPEQQQIVELLALLDGTAKIVALDLLRKDPNCNLNRITEALATLAPEKPIKDITLVDVANCKQQIGQSINDFHQSFHIVCVRAGVEIDGQLKTFIKNLADPETKRHLVAATPMTVSKAVEIIKALEDYGSDKALVSTVKVSKVSTPSKENSFDMTSLTEELYKTVKRAMTDHGESAPAKQGKSSQQPKQQ